MTFSKYLVCIDILKISLGQDFNVCLYHFTVDDLMPRTTTQQKSIDSRKFRVPFFAKFRVSGAIFLQIKTSERKLETNVLEIGSSKINP